MERERRRDRKKEREGNEERRGERERERGREGERERKNMITPCTHTRRNGDERDAASTRASPTATSVSYIGVGVGLNPIP